ncbi:MAG: LytTR family transcriptional regulator DNA-binding domain-containing protein [Bacteroidales bacterium]
MKKTLTWINREIPANFLIQKPVQGAVAFFLIFFLFAIIYQPLYTHPSRFFSYPVTAALYSFIVSAAVAGIVRILNRFRFFSKIHEWTILRELLAVLIALTGMGLSVYFAAFIIEEPANRWNIATLYDSVLKSFLLGVIPFIFFNLLNFRYWLGQVHVVVGNDNTGEAYEPAEELIRISSRLKKEELSFYPGQFVYAESDSNYVNFYIWKDNKLKKEVIRNSISNVEEQFADFPYMVRTHRAYIVNIRKITQKKGNVLGYRLKLNGVDQEIPVSRNNTAAFNNAIKQLSLPAFSYPGH